MNKQKIILALCSVALVLPVAACAHPAKTSNGQAKENQQQAQDTTTLINNQPVPGYNYSQIRQNLIDIENAEANGAQSTSFFFNFGIQDPYMSCPSIGAPIPVTMSLTNPSQITWGANNAGPAVTDQMDPNGVYAAQGSSGTWVQCIGANGKITPQYAEESVHTVFAPAVWDETNHQIKIIGASSVNFSSGKGK